MRKTNTLAVSLVLIFTALINAAAAHSGADARAEETLKRARAAIGGEEKVRAVQSMTALGKFRRTLGEREQSGEREVSFQLPDKYVSTDTFAVGGLSTAVSSSKVLDGERAAMAGRGQMIIMGGPGVSEEQKQAMYRRNFRSEWARLLVGLLLTSPQSFPVEFKYVGEAEAEDGRADVLDATGPDGFAARLFLDKETHLPLMLTFKSRMQRLGGGGTLQMRHGMSPAEMEKMAREQAEKAGPPQEVEQQIRFSEYKRVGALMLPHRISQGEDGQVREEWEVTKYEINPQLKADTFKRD